MLRMNWKYMICGAALAMLVGCSGAESVDTVKVSGTVTLDGKALPGAAVTFAPTDASGRTAAGLTDADGKFALTTVTSGDGALPGKYQVGIRKPIARAITDSESDPRGKGGTLSQEQMKRMMEMSKGRPKKNGKAADLVPQKYHDPTSSGLEAEVKTSDKNEFTFPLSN